MKTNNDEKILELKKQIDEKKKKIGKAQKFQPVTNCSFEIDGERKNIQAMNKEQLIMYAVKLNSLALSAKDLGLLDDFMISSYHVNQWIEDLQSKLNHIQRKDEEQKLKAMEAKLDLLLSNEKKVELEIDEIAALLKE